MHTLDSNQHFLIISEINLFPELKTETVSMIEQIMNALLLSCHENIQEGINRVIALESICKNNLTDSYVSVLQRIQTFLGNHQIFITQGEKVRLFYPRYHNSKFYYKDIGKQAAINTEFAMEKKISYDGKDIIFEDSYNSWVNGIINRHRETNLHNPKDKLMFHIIEPQVNLKHIQAINIIQEETHKYVDEYRKIVELEKDFK